MICFFKQRKPIEELKGKKKKEKVVTIPMLCFSDEVHLLTYHT